MKNIINKYIVLLALIISGSSFAQVLISKDGDGSEVPHPSAMLELRDEARGILLPRVALPVDDNQLNDNTSPVLNPSHGLLVVDTTRDKLFFWDNQITPAPGKWIRNFEEEDALGLVEVTTNYTASSTGNGTTISGFPGTASFALNSGKSGWTKIDGVSLTLQPTKTANTVFVSAEGMVHLNNNNATSFEFAVGLFVDNQLKVVRKYTYTGNNACSWQKFELNGLFENMTTDNHTIELYARNMVKGNTGNNYGTGLIYGGGWGTGSCTNLNSAMAKVFLTAQVTE